MVARYNAIMVTNYVAGSSTCGKGCIHHTTTHPSACMGQSSACFLGVYSSWCCACSIMLQNHANNLMVFLPARCCRNGTNFQRILLEMIQSGKYYPAATWVIPYQGRGMSHERCQALWRMITAPTTVQPEHVHRWVVDTTQFSNARNSSTLKVAATVKEATCSCFHRK